MRYLLTPVNLLRYFEFDFAWPYFAAGQCLDLSSHHDCSSRDAANDCPDAHID